MSEAEELVRQALNAWNRRDIEALFALTDPAVEYVNAPEAVEPGTRRGRDEVSKVMQKQWEILEEGHQEIAAVHERGEEIITENIASRRMPESDDWIENHVLISWTVRDGVITRIEVLGGGSGFAEARARAGIGEGPAA